MENINIEGCTIEELGEQLRQSGVNITNEELILDMMKEGFLEIPEYRGDYEGLDVQTDENGHAILTPKQTLLLALYMFGFLPADEDDVTRKRNEERFEQFWNEVETGFIPYYVNHHFGIDLPIPGNQLLKED